MRRCRFQLCIALWHPCRRCCPRVFQGTGVRLGMPRTAQSHSTAGCHNGEGRSCLAVLARWPTSIRHDELAQTEQHRSLFRNRPCLCPGPFEASVRHPDQAVSKTISDSSTWRQVTRLPQSSVMGVTHSARIVLTFAAFDGTNSGSLHGSPSLVVTDERVSGFEC